MIDTDASPGDYAPYFERAPTYMANLAKAAEHLHRMRVRADYAAVRKMFADLPDATPAAKPRCYRDRQTRAKLIATTNEIRAKYGMPPWQPE